MSDSRITHVQRAGFTFNVTDTGPIDGTPIVLLHGFPQRATCWSQVAERLHTAGMRTYALDQRGYSPGARPSSRFAYKTSDLVDDAKALMDEIGQPVHLSGHDWGAVVGWGIAARYPDLLRSYTAISVAHPAAFMKSMYTSTQALKSYYMLLFQLPWLPEKLLSKPGGFGEKMLRGAGMDRTMIETFRREIVADGALRGGLGYYRSLMFNSPDLMRRITVPTTYVWSEDDVALGPKGAELTPNYVKGPYQLAVIKKATHWLLDQNPDEVAHHITARVRSV
jgi:pimeloyl-ACP methyl ester carboxylesterase